ncbi:MAG: hypothetical protein PVJ57_05365 [Phycisphaerae bacterium]|jgi:hypothetical protein
MSVSNPFWRGAIVILVIAVLAAPALGQGSTRYRLLEGTALVFGEDPMIELPLHGTFDLVTTSGSDSYDVRNFRGFDDSGNEAVTGEGTYVQNDAFQQMILGAVVNGDVHHLDSGPQPYYTTLPMIEIILHEEPVPMRLIVVAVPATPAWFSTETGFHTPAGTAISDGDILTTYGSVLWTNAELTQNLGIEPVVPDVGLDAMHPMAVWGPLWWEGWFSMEIDQYSETLGPLQHGDFLSEGGFIVARNQDLTQSFEPLEPGDLGLDAITWEWSSNCKWFSTEVDFHSEAVGALVGHGDVLCATDGAIVYTNQELLARIQPLVPDHDYGLDALYRWPSGHVWFSTEESFHSLTHGWISDGDLLSMDGFIIYRNLDLVRRFEPVEDLDNFGLDALHVVPVQPGDMNGDAFINNLDLAPFVLALTNREAYYAQFPELDPDVVGDLNGDRVLDNFDISLFIRMLTLP